MSTTLLPTQNSGTQPPSTHGILEIAQAQELQSRTIRTNAEAHEFFRARLDAEIKQHQKDIEAFNKRLTELNVREQEVNTKSEKTNKTWLEASEAEEKAKKLNEENAKQKALLDPLIAQGEEIKTRKEAAEQTVSIRRLGSQAQTEMSLEEALRTLADEAVAPDVKRAG